MPDITALATSIKSTFDLAKSAKDVNDQARANAAIIGIMQQLMEVQSTLNATQIENRTLLEEVDRLKAELDDKKRFEDYRLEKTPMGGFILMLKESCITDDRPPHAVCPHCKEDGRLSVLSESACRFECSTCRFNAGKQPRPVRPRGRTTHPGFM